MNFISTDLESILSCLDKLQADKRPAWGGMSAQQMVEHLSDSVKTSYKPSDHAVNIPEEQVKKMQEFLFSDHPIARNVPNPNIVAPENYIPRNEELALAIDELSEIWMAYEEFFEQNPTTKIMHPIFGELDKKGMDRFHSKHFTHHFTQFELL